MAARFLTLKSVGLIQIRNIPANSLSLDVRSGLLDGLMRARKEKMEAIVIFGEGRGFSAGADINEFPRRRHLQTPMLGDVVKAIDQSEIPVIAGIHGYCYGGALELALACQFRLADRTAKLAFPEVNIGLIPGAGGTQRLPRLVGSELALDMCVYGEPLDSHASLQHGLVDKLLQHDMSIQISGQNSKVTENFAIEELADYALEQAEEARRNKDFLDSRRLSQLALKSSAAGQEGAPPDEFWLDYHAKNIANGSVKHKNGSKAPVAAFRCVQIACKVPTFDAGLTMERRQFEELSQGVEARSLQYSFFGDKKAKQILAAIDYAYKTDNIGESSSSGNGNGNGKNGGGLSGVSEEEVQKARKVWTLCQRMLDRYATEVALLIDKGLARPDEVDEALAGFMGMPHKPTELARALGALPPLPLPGEESERGGVGSTSSGRATPPGVLDPFAKSLNKADIAARCLFPMINEGFDLLQTELDRAMSSGGGGDITDDNANSGGGGSAMITPDEVDAVFRHAPLLSIHAGTGQEQEQEQEQKVPSLTGAVFPRYRGGPLFFAENDVGLRDVLSMLKSWHEAEPDRQPSLQPSGLLVDTVQGCSTLREEIYYKSESG